MNLCRVVFGSVLMLMLAPLAVAYAGGAKCSADAQTCLNHWAADAKEKGWLGVEYDKDAATGTWTVKTLVPGGPAEKAGFKVGDQVVEANGVRLAKDLSEADRKKMKSGMKAGAAVAYVVKRAGAETQLTATLAPLPEEVLARMVGMHMLSEHVAVAAAASSEKKDEKEKSKY